MYHCLPPTCFSWNISKLLTFYTFILSYLWSGWKNDITKHKHGISLKYHVVLRVQIWVFKAGTGSNTDTSIGSVLSQYWYQYRYSGVPVPILVSGHHCFPYLLVSPWCFSSVSLHSWVLPRPLSPAPVGINHRCLQSSLQSLSTRTLRPLQSDIVPLRRSNPPRTTSTKNKRKISNEHLLTEIFKNLSSNV